LHARPKPLPNFPSRPPTASQIVIDPKNRVFQRNRRIPRVETMPASPPTCDLRGHHPQRQLYADCVEKPPKWLPPENGYGAAFAFLDARRSHIEATELVRRRPQSDAGRLAKNSRAASLALVVVIEPKIRVFQHNTSAPTVRCAQGAVPAGRPGEPARSTPRCPSSRARKRSLSERIDFERSGWCERRNYRRANLANDKGAALALLTGVALFMRALICLNRTSTCLDAAEAKRSASSGRSLI
jgi:hypothetical protein